jgi:hypothetical protein
VVSMRRSVELVREFLFPASVPPRGIPTMEGGLTPNDALDGFEILPGTEGADPEDVVLDRSGRLLLADGPQIRRIDPAGGRDTVLASFAGRVLGLALEPEGDRLLACVDRVGLVGVSPDGSVEVLLDVTDGTVGVLSAVASTGDAVYVTEVAAGEKVSSWDEWPRDLLGRGATGRVLEVRDGAPLRVVASRLAWPYGLTAIDGRLLVSESWRHRIIGIDPATGATATAVDRLPAYPARLHETADGAVAVGFFAARNNLVELVLREDSYRLEMMRTIPMEDWIRPALDSTLSVREPLQIGRIMNLGEVKPWAPPRSYGLVATLDGSELLAGRHARSGSARHGTTAYLRTPGAEYVTSRAARAVLVKRTETRGAA